MTPSFVCEKEKTHTNFQIAGKVTQGSHGLKLQAEHSENLAEFLQKVKAKQLTYLHLHISKLHNNKKGGSIS